MQHLQEGAHGLGINLSAFQLEQFARYQSLLLDWNQRINLTAIREPAGIQMRHFLDSLTCAQITGNLNGRSLIDIGTGAGFPGLPLKLLYPELTLTLVESVRKKVQFLEVVVTELALEGVTIFTARAEELGQHPDHREQYDWATARAVANLRILVEFLLPFCHVGGAVLAQKGASAAAELAAAKKAIEILGGGAPHLDSILLPQQTSPHFFVVIPKIQPTPAKYPRHTGRPAKRPL